MEIQFLLFYTSECKFVMFIFRLCSFNRHRVFAVRFTLFFLLLSLESRVALVYKVHGIAGKMEGVCQRLQQESCGKDCRKEYFSRVHFSLDGQARQNYGHRPGTKPHVARSTRRPEKRKDVRRIFPRPSFLLHPFLTPKTFSLSRFFFSLA